MALSDQLETILTKNKDSHLNFEDYIEPKKISSGSLILDKQLGGGFSPGFHRFTGVTEGGKTSAILEAARNFRLVYPDDGEVIWFKAEGRLSAELLTRSGVLKVEDFVKAKVGIIPKDKSEVGECYFKLDRKQRLKMPFVVLESNEYEFIAGTTKNLVLNNPENKRRFFAYDSTDGFITKADKEKDFTEAAQVSAAARLSSLFLKHVTPYFDKFVHYGFLVSQLRSGIQLNQYEKKENRTGGSSGGFALQHYPNTILEFLPRFKSDQIITADKKTILGHFCKIDLCKTGTEKSGSRIMYPIKYGVTGGSSVWVAKEIVDVLLAQELVSRKGAWYSFDNDFREYIKSKFDVEITSEQMQGENSLFEYISNDDAVLAALYSNFLEL